MQLLTQFLLTMLTNATVQQLILLGLREAAKRSDNTIDDQVVAIVENGYKTALTRSSVRSRWSDEPGASIRLYRNTGIW